MFLVVVPESLLKHLWDSAFLKSKLLEVKTCILTSGYLTSLEGNIAYGQGVWVVGQDPRYKLRVSTDQLCDLSSSWHIVITQQMFPFTIYILHNTQDNIWYPFCAQ